MYLSYVTLRLTGLHKDNKIYHNVGKNYYCIFFNLAKLHNFIRISTPAVEKTSTHYLE